MKKETALLIALLLLPLLAVGIAVSPASVTVIQDQTLTTMSFAQTVDGSAFGWCAPVALLMTYGIFASAVIYALTKKPFWLKAIRAVSFLAMFLAVLPIIVQDEIRIIPNVMVGIALGAQWAAAHFAIKKSGKQEEKKPAGNRLPNH